MAGEVRSTLTFQFGCEVWGERWTPALGQGWKRVEGQPLLCLGAAVHRDPRPPAYENFFRKLFDLYRGKY